VTAYRLSVHSCSIINLFALLGIKFYLLHLIFYFPFWRLSRNLARIYSKGGLVGNQGNLSLVTFSSFLPSFIPSFLPSHLPSSLLCYWFLTFLPRFFISLPYRDTHFKDSSGVKVQADALEALRLVLVGKVDEVSPCSLHIICHIPVLLPLSSFFL
jgi:hypothetical protein